MTTANRGKVAEAKLQKALQDYDGKHADFDWGRVYDAHSAGGKFACQTGDFMWFHRNANGVIELKEVAHDYRLPTKNFNPGQIARMRKRMLAGAAASVVVYHSTTGKWRLVGLQYFLDRLEDKSWDLRDYPEYVNAAEVLQTLFNLYVTQEKVAA